METSVLSGLELTKWRRNFIREFVRDSGFEPYMGDSQMDIIHVINDLKTDGYTIRVPLLKQLRQAGVSGSQKLSGNEEPLNQFYQDISWEFYRHAVEIDKKEREKSAVDLLAAVRPQLRDWASELIKYQIIDSFHKINGKKYSAASEADKDAWLADNADRVLFGASVGNNASNDHSAALGQIDDTADKLTPAVASLAKRLAKKARPRIRPFKTGTQGREFFVMFCHPLCFRDLKNDSVMTQANRDARPRDVEANPLFQDGDLIYDGIIFREIPEFWQPRFEEDEVNTETTLVGVGNGGIDVGVNFLCGAQALGYVNKQAALPTTKKEDDYGFVKGMGIEMAHGIEKLTWGNGADQDTDPRKDVGVFTVYAAAKADA